MNICGLSSIDLTNEIKFFISIVLVFISNSDNENFLFMNVLIFTKSTSIVGGVEKVVDIHIQWYNIIS